MSLKKEWTAIQNTMLSVGVSIFQPIADWLNSPEGKEWIKGLKESIINIGKFIKSAIQLLGPTGTLGVMTAIFLGRMGLLGPLIKGLGSFVGGIGRLIPALGSFVKNGVTKLIPSLSKGAGGAGPGGGAGAAMGQQSGVGGMTKGMNPGSMIKGAAAMVIMAGALWVLAKALQEFDKLSNGWETLAMAGVSLVGLTAGVYVLSQIPSSDLMEGALALAVMGAAFIPLAFGLSLLQGLSWEVLGMAGVALIGLTLAVIGLGAIMMSGFGAAAIILGAAALAIMGAALVVFGLGISMVVDPLATFLEKVVTLGASTVQLMAIGPALMLMSLGIMTLAASLLVLGAAYALGGWLGLIALGETADELKTAFGDIDAKGISDSINAINNADMDKIKALRDLSMSMSMWGMFGAKPIEVRMTVDGDIELSGEGGGKSNTEWINDPTFVSNLKDLIAQQMEKDKGGGGH
jgi:hypothetical protein